VRSVELNVKISVKTVPNSSLHTPINPAVINLYLQFSQVVDFTNVFAKNDVVLSAPG
jgi:hypothetical protein